MQTEVATCNNTVAKGNTYLITDTNVKSIFSQMSFLCWRRLSQTNLERKISLKFIKFHKI